MFEEQFTDSMRTQRSRQQLEKLRFKFPEINQYIADFEDLANLSGYMVGNDKTINLFLKGFKHAQDILGGMLTPPIPITYHALKDRAISVMKSQQLMNVIQRGAPVSRPQQAFLLARCSTQALQPGRFQNRKVLLR